MQAQISRLNQLNDERNKLMKQLEMWAEVKAQGISPDDVDVFGFDPKLVTPEELNEARKAVRKAVYMFVPTNDNPYNFPTYRNEQGQLRYKVLKYNYVRLNDGTKKRLIPMIERPDE